MNLISAAGLGAITATIVQSWLAERKENRQRIFKEKKEAYVGFLEACYKSEVFPNNENSHYAGHWINICKIVGSKEVNELLQQHLSTNPVDGKIHPDRPTVLDKIYKAMRTDLGFPNNE